MRATTSSTGRVALERSGWESELLTKKEGLSSIDKPCIAQVASRSERIEEIFVEKNSLKIPGSEDVGCFVGRGRSPLFRQSAEMAPDCLARSQQTVRHQKPIESTLTPHKYIEINGELLPSPNSLSLPKGLPPSSHFFVDPGSARAKFDTLLP
jgi:hypothetical protein